MSKQVRVNVATLVNASRIRREKRNGRDVVVVPSATMPDDIVMNGSGGPIMYPAAEIEKSYKGLERTPAPLGHPFVNGRFVSARDPEGLTRGWFGAWNENVRRENGRVLLDKVIDVEVANQSEGGKAVLAAIEKQEPIHTSTGLLALLDVANAADHKFTARDIVFDHDCFLLDQPGAATPEQGVGVFVNSAGDQIEVINSSIDDEIDRDLNWQLDAMLRTLERKERQPLLERIKIAIQRIVQGDPTPGLTEGGALTANEEAMDQAQFDALSGKVEAISATVAGMPEAISAAVANAMKPVADALAAQAQADADKAEAERLDLVNQVVAAELLDEAAAKEAAVPVLNALLAKQPKQAFRVNGAFKPGPKQTDIAALAPKGD